MLHRILEYLKRLRRNTLPEEVQIDDRGYRILQGGTQTAEVQWNDVREVFIYKKDLIATDLICIGFRISDDGTHMVLHEEGNYWESLLEWLPKVFPGIRTDWHQDVVLPPFEPCLTLLWGEPQIADPQPPAA